MSDIKEEQPIEKKQSFLIELSQMLQPYYPQIGTAIVIFVAIGIVSAMLYFGADSKLFLQIGENSSSFARGLITILFVFITIVLALMLIFSVLFSSSADYEKRFVIGKEILTIFIGILGTIVGFYFGSAPNDNAKAKDELIANVVKTVSSSKEQISNDTVQSLALTVYIQIYSEKDRDKAKEFQTKLLENKFVVPGIENVGDDNGSKADPIKQNIVKYYNDADKTNAEKIQALIDPTFVIQKGITKQKVLAGTIEVWFKTPETGAEKNAN
jgi:hypothetical protein